jgi:hypothetical protein
MAQGDDPTVLDKAVLFSKMFPGEGVIEQPWTILQGGQVLSHPQEPGPSLGTFFFSLPMGAR